MSEQHIHPYGLYQNITDLGKQHIFFCLSRGIDEASEMERSETEELTPLLNSQNHVLGEPYLLSEDTHHHQQQQQQQQPQQPQDVHQQISEQQNESPSKGVNQFIVNMTGNITGPIQINTDQGQGTQVVHVASQGKVSY